MPKSSRQKRNWRIASVMGIRGACAAHRGEFAAAETALLTSLSVVQGGVSEDHEELELALGRLRDLYMLWGKPGEASEYETP